MKPKDRYIVMKLADVHRMSASAQQNLLNVLEEYKKARADKKASQVVVIESGWPEYETTVTLLDARVEGKGQQVRGMNIEEMIKEWRRGCSCAGPVYDKMMQQPEGTTGPEECPECTKALIEAIERTFKTPDPKNEEAPAGKKVGELMVEVGFSGNKVSELVQFILDAVAEGGMTAECGEELGRHLAGLEVGEVSPDSNVERNRKMLLDRSVVGLQKYGVTTERNDLTPAQWAQHAIEEALDFANYLQALKKKLEDLDNE